MARVVVICGTGMSSLSSDFAEDGFELINFRTESPWGDVPCVLIQCDVGEIIIIDRHHSQGTSRTPPHKIEHRANINAASSSGSDLILSINSVGSMREDLPPGMIGVSGDVLDLSIKPWTFHDHDAFHADRTSIFDNSASEICHKALTESQGFTPTNLVVAQCVGPQFESPSEIDALIRLGADVVGMTLGPESRLVAETGISHVALACSSNWAAGKTPGNPSAEIDHQAVDAMATTLRARVKQCILALLNQY